MDSLLLGNGLTNVILGDHGAHQIDLIGWTAWYADNGETYKDKPFDLVRAVQAKLAEELGIKVNLSLADAFLHGINLAYNDLKKKQHDERTSANFMGSTPSDSAQSRP